jgi:hypothetical protein
MKDDPELVYKDKVPAFKTNIGDMTMFYFIPRIFRDGTTIEDAQKIVQKLINSKLFTNQIIREELVSCLSQSPN